MKKDGVCTKCGAEHNRRHAYCSACYNKQRWGRWRKRKIEAVDQLGGVCSKCGWAPNAPYEYAAMDFHHLDPSTKEKPLADLWLAKKEVREAELAKCVLLCANCHRIHHADSWEVEADV